MLSLKMFFIMLVACWAIHLQFKLVLDSKGQLGVSIANLWSSLLLSNIVTIPAILATFSKVGKSTVGIRWICVAPYLLTCIFTAANKVIYMVDAAVSLSIQPINDFDIVVLNLIMMFVLLVFSLLEIGLAMFFLAGCNVPLEPPGPHELATIIRMEITPAMAARICGLLD
ncbi:hypothetical protein KR093_007700 [Drosophila rubida]|uniref:Uncharacterized protein n=1 Tax=Drosophila rubida TaxID=30044 RepID=A0AAD4PLR8_9MUSC|nr:hypothetical protein KR093_007700 [Drosophila rubida]